MDGGGRDGGVGSGSNDDGVVAVMEAARGGLDSAKVGEETDEGFVRSDRVRMIVADKISLRSR